MAKSRVIEGMNMAESASQESCQPSPEPTEPIRRPKRRWMLPVIFAAVVVVIAAVLVLRHFGHGENAEPPLLKADAAQLKRTVVTPILEEPIRQGKNVILVLDVPVGVERGLQIRRRRSPAQ